MRPPGLLINLQPYAEPIRVDVRFGDRRKTVGTALDAVEKLIDMREAWRRVDEAVRAGIFEPRRNAPWRFEMEYANAEDWLVFADKPNCGGIHADARRLDEAFAHPDGGVITSEDNFAAVYDRREGGR